MRICTTQIKVDHITNLGIQKFLKRSKEQQLAVILFTNNYTLVLPLKSVRENNTHKMIKDVDKQLEYNTKTKKFEYVEKQLKCKPHR